LERPFTPRTRRDLLEDRCTLLDHHRYGRSTVEDLGQLLMILVPLAVAYVIFCLYILPVGGY